METKEIQERWKKAKFGDLKIHTYQSGYTVKSRIIEIAAVDKMTSRVELLSLPKASALANAPTDIAYLLTENDELKRQVEELTETRDTYWNWFCEQRDLNNARSKHFAELEAGAAAMREASKKVIDNIAINEKNEDVYDGTQDAIDNYYRLIDSSTAGRDLLGRVEKMGEALEQGLLLIETEYIPHGGIVLEDVHGYKLMKNALSAHKEAQ